MDPERTRLRLAAEDAMEKLFLNLALIETPEKLQGFVDKTVFTVLDKMDTEFKMVILKGKELLDHLTNRIKGSDSVQMKPDLYVDYVAQQTRHVPLTFAVTLLKTAINRMSEQEYVQYLPKLLTLLKTKAEQKLGHAANEVLFTLVNGIALLGNRRVETWPSGIMELFRDASVKRLIIQVIRDVIAFQYTDVNMVKNRAMLVTENVTGGQEPGIEMGAYSDIGLKIVVPGNTSITEMKVGFLNFLGKDVYTEVEAFPALVLGKANRVDKVNSIGEMQLRKVHIEPCVNDPTVVSQLFLWYLGRECAKDNVRTEIGKADIPLKMVILPLLVKSTTAATTFPGNYKVAFGALTQDPEESRPMKVQMLGAQFLQAIVEKMPARFLPNFGPIIFKQLTKLMMECEHRNVVAALYRSYGILGKKLPNLVAKNLDLLNETFEAVTTAPEDVIGAIQDCLVDWLPSYAAIQDPATLNMLETVVAQFVKVEKCALVALKYIAALNNTKSPIFRWLLVQCFNTGRYDLEKEASRLLQLSLAKPQFLPDFTALVNLFYKNLKIEYVTGNLEAAEHKGADLAKAVLTEKTYLIASIYLLAAAAAHSKCSGKFFGVMDDDLKLEEMPKIAGYLRTTEPETLKKFVEIVLTSVWEATNIDSSLLHICVLALSCAPSAPSSSLRHYVREKLRTVAQSSNRFEVCSVGARAFMHILDETEVENEFKQTVEKMTKLDKDFVPGSAWIVSQLSLHPKVVSQEAADVQKALFKSIQMRAAEPNIVLETQLSSLAEFLRMASNDPEKHSHLMSERPKEVVEPFIEVLSKILVSRKDTINMRMKESAAACLGFLSSIQDGFDVAIKAQLVTALFEAGEGPPLPELQFNVGDALFDSMCGEASDARRNVYLTAPEDLKLTTEIARIEDGCREILDKIIATKLSHANRHVRQAALVWLFCLTKRGSALRVTVVDKYIDRIQAAFINGLAEADAFTQDVASKGVGLVYSLAPKEMQQALVEQLIEALSTGRKATVKVTDDTVLFEEGQLGGDKTGGSISTYKEICSLATDMNQPDLVYKFLNLAGHNAKWNSKKGAAFGFGAVFEIARSELQPYVATLVPKLYRYTYDPDMNVQLAMRSIWKEVTSAQKNAIDTYANEILKECKSTMLNREWRVRESSCLALADLLAGHFTNAMCEQLGDILVDLLRVQDDVKESVRIAATRALKQVEKTIYKYGAEGMSTATNIIGNVLPVLVEKGIQSTVKSNRLFGLRCLMEMAKEAGKSLKPFLPTIIRCLLDALSETEPSVLNYLAVRADDSEREMLDDARSTAVRTSPMMTSLNDIIPLLDEEVYSEIGDIIQGCLRNSVGLTSRNGCAQWLTNICLRQQNMMRTCHSINGKLFNTLKAGLNDRNPAVRKQFSSTLSYILPFCPESSVEKLVQFVSESATSIEDEKRQAVYHVLRALVNQCPEFLFNYNKELLPVVFLATFDKIIPGDADAKRRHELWLELWNDMIPGTESAVRMYSTEMIDLAVNMMKNNPAYTVRSNSAAMLAQVFYHAGSGLSAEKADEFYTTIVEFLPGRIWEGKETVLNAVEALAEKSAEQLKQKWSKEEFEQKFAPLYKETQKKNVVYKSQAIKAAVSFCQNLSYVEGAEKLDEFLTEQIKKRNEDDDSDDEEGSKHQKITQKQEYLAIVAEFLAKLLVVYPDESKITLGLTTLFTILTDASVYWKAKHAAIRGLLVFVKQHDFTHPFNATLLFNTVIDVLQNSVLQRKTFAQDTCAVLQRLVELAKKLESFTFDEEVREALMKVVTSEEMAASPLCQEAVQEMVQGYGEKMC
ncbi:hypothetical protein L596_017067 [Steinernema carpocapsae]|uniref:TOG domain-containing protein n=1 Tax=Steinernema carpocapsae TaxID=34508 RepID=A0A4U5N0R2_STECR|nr:hypothetical protein L596_017067 [Steinernema carpocapsae]